MKLAEAPERKGQDLEGYLQSWLHNVTAEHKGTPSRMKGQFDVAKMRQLRKNAGLTQEALAKKSGLHKKLICLIECGHQKPSLKDLFALARGLDCEPKDFSPWIGEIKQLEGLDYNIAIGNGVRAVRERLRMNQKELAEQVGTSQPAISEIERGVRQPLLYTVRALVQALRCELNDLLHHPPLLSGTQTHSSQP